MSNMINVEEIKCTSCNANINVSGSNIKYSKNNGIAMATSRSQEVFECEYCNTVLVVSFKDNFEIPEGELTRLNNIVNRGVNVGGSVGGSVVTGKVKTGGDWVGGDKFTIKGKWFK